MEAVDRAGHGRTSILVTHHFDLALDSERVVVFEGGRIVEDGAPLDLIATDDGPFALLAGTVNGRG
jgi:ATP-binding cassette subfamily B protein